MFVPLRWSPSTARNSRFGGMAAPAASAGIFGMFSPNVCPAPIGAQSGIRKLMRLKPPMTALIARMIWLRMFLIGCATALSNHLPAALHLCTIASQALPAAALTESQFFTSSATTAMIAPTAATANPIGEVRNAIAAPSAAVPAAAAAEMAVQSVTAAFTSPNAAAKEPTTAAIFEMASWFPATQSANAVRSSKIFVNPSEITSASRSVPSSPETNSNAAWNACPIASKTEFAIPCQSSPVRNSRICSPTACHSIVCSVWVMALKKPVTRLLAAPARPVMSSASSSPASVSSASLKPDQSSSPAAFQSTAETAPLISAARPMPKPVQSKV